MKRFVNPLQMGLLGGFAAWANTMEKYNMMNAQNAAIEQRYRTKYDAMAQVQSERAKNNALLNQMKLEANQRTSKVDGVQGDDGKLYSVTYRSVYNPATQQYEQHEIGRVPYESKMDVAAQSQKAIADRMAANRAAIDADATARQDRIDKRTQQRLDAKSAEDEKKDQRTKLGQAETATNKDMKDFRAMTPEEQAKELAAAGVDVSVPNPEGSKGFFSDTSTKPNPDAEKQYRKAMLEQHKAELGIGEDQGAAGGAAAPSPTGAQPQYTPDGRQIKYDSNGNAFIKGPDGKPVPYVADANGMPDSPLAMDTIGGDEEQPAVDQEGEESAPSGAGLLAGADAGPDDTEEEPAPDEEDQGLMSGQYA